MRGFIRRAHGKLVVIELAEEHPAIAPKIRGDGRFIGRNEIFQNVRTGCGAHAVGAEQIFDAEGQPLERSTLTFSQTCVGRARHLASPIRRFQHEGV